MSIPTAVRPAAMAGRFYPAAAPALRAQLADLLARAAPAPAPALAPAPASPPAESRPKLIVVPHAGYVYSGAIAAAAYARLRPQASQIRRVVLLGPAHRVALQGLALPQARAFETPLGRVPIDEAGCAALAGLPQVRRDDRPHAQEHALEVQLPFLQTVLPQGFDLLPIVVGEAAPDAVAQVIDRLWGGDETLIVVSTDLSHFLAHAEATSRDRRTVARIQAFATDIDPYDACGARVLNGALRSARQHGLRPELLDLCNSGDTAGERSRVVGYAALVFTAPPMPADVTTGAAANAATNGATHAATDAVPDAAPAVTSASAAAPEDPALRTALLACARNAIAQRLGEPLRDEPTHPALDAPGAAFVSLHDAQGTLRGCVGHLEARGTLANSVRHNAEAAAFRDSRFTPLARDDWPGLQLEVSVLDAPEALPPAATEDEARAALVPGRDGVILRWRDRRATFLPQVWDELPTPEAFLAALKRKAGLASGFWSPEIQLMRYGVRRFA